VRESELRVDRDRALQQLHRGDLGAGGATRDRLGIRLQCLERRRSGFFDRRVVAGQ
jgi:hypothetical protein